MSPVWFSVVTEICLLTTMTLGIYVPKPRFNSEVFDAADKCDKPVECDENARFRTIDGSCNNLKNQTWGKALTAMGRLIQANYNDGVHEPRKAKNGEDLPSARSVVNTVFDVADTIDNNITLAAMTVSQILTHDLALIAIRIMYESQCCEGIGNCLNINVDANDPYYKKYNVTCLPFERSNTTATLNCTLTPEYQLDRVSHYVDASFLYGRSKKISHRLREHRGGRLKFITKDGGSFPPQKRNHTKYWMDTGDKRANQNPPLSSLQILALREHNRIANTLWSINPRWDDERLFQEARKAFIAEWQIIAFRDWLPIYIGEEAAKQENLIPASEKLSTDYDPHTSPKVTSDFSSGAFRILHGLIPRAYCSKAGVTVAQGCRRADLFSETYEKPDSVFGEAKLDVVLSGLTTAHSGIVGHTVSRKLSGELFHFDKKYGHDLISTDIQRGRDAGLPSYNDYRKLCGLKSAENWNELENIINAKLVERLKKVYTDVDDIDMYIGAMLEEKIPGAQVGLTGQCIIVDQFTRIKRGDRFFHDLGSLPHSYKLEQVAALQATSFSKWLCDNARDVVAVPTNAFIIGSPMIECDKMPSVDFSSWKEHEEEDDIRL